VDLNDKKLDDGGWPEKMPRYIIEHPIRDLLNKEIDFSTNVLGNLWLERGTYGAILGSSGIGKSVLAIQIGALAAMGRDVFGIKVDAPLKVLIVQAEDSLNDRREQVTGIINSLYPTERELDLVDTNLCIITPEHRADRGKSLFDYLRSTFKDVKLDLVIFNPAFAFIEGNLNNAESVGDFLRNHLQQFLRDKNAAGLVIHHVPKPPKSGKRGREADTTMYSAFGSVEFANAPRASMTIDRTMASWVFEFTIGKRGQKSGWKPDRSGDYRRYFTHSKTNRLFWEVASDSDVAAANSGIGEEDFAEIFKGDDDLTLETIQKRFKHYGFSFEGEELMTLLENLVNRGKLTTTFIEGGPFDGHQTWHGVKSAPDKETQSQRMENVMFYIEEAGSKGIITSELRKVVSFGHGRLKDALNVLESEGKIYKVKEGSNTNRYFAK
jgi:hypothetical protein